MSRVVSTWMRLLVCRTNENECLQAQVDSNCIPRREQRTQLPTEPNHFVWTEFINYWAAKVICYWPSVSSILNLNRFRRGNMACTYVSVDTPEFADVSRFSFCRWNFSNNSPPPAALELIGTVELEKRFDEIWIRINSGRQFFKFLRKCTWRFGWRVSRYFWEFRQPPVCSVQPLAGAFVRLLGVGVDFVWVWLFCRWVNLVVNSSPSMWPYWDFHGRQHCRHLDRWPFVSMTWVIELQQVRVILIELRLLLELMEEPNRMEMKCSN